MIADYELSEMERVFRPEKKYTALAGMGLKLAAEIRRLQKENRDAKIAGIKLAAEVAKDYDHLSLHPYLPSECIAGKLNVLKRKPRKNPVADKVDRAIVGLERKVDSLDGTMRFMVLASKLRLARKR